MTLLREVWIDLVLPGMRDHAAVGSLGALHLAPASVVSQSTSAVQSFLSPPVANASVAEVGLTRITRPGTALLVQVTPWSPVTHTSPVFVQLPARPTQATSELTAAMYCSSGAGFTAAAGFAEAVVFVGFAVRVGVFVPELVTAADT
jgi:hypothetical protein